MWRLFLYLSQQTNWASSMYKLSGEYRIKLDEKSRLRLPTALIRQLSSSTSIRLVIHRGIEKCLLLYPQEVWEEKTKEVNQLNLYNSKKRAFARYFHRGATELIVDSADRILIPKSLAEHAGIKQDIVLNAYINQIEIWDQEEYLNMIANEPEDFSSIAEEVFRQKDV
ncbi:MAG: division/cell wall cluster transcriptional repressor MraZ [Bacteroidota bacterium]|nr:division/cell wall cluster transcriptional repressor MraZ [Bacteroidota bacterium]